MSRYMQDYKEFTVEMWMMYWSQIWKRWTKPMFEFAYDLMLSQQGNVLLEPQVQEWKNYLSRR